MEAQRPWASMSGAAQLGSFTREAASLSWQQRDPLPRWPPARPGAGGLTGACASLPQSPGFLKDRVSTLACAQKSLHTLLVTQTSPAARGRGEGTWLGVGSLGPLGAGCPLTPGFSRVQPAHGGTECPVTAQREARHRHFLRLSGEVLEPENPWPPRCGP